jgi:hypothetical protein
MRNIRIVSLLILVSFAGCKSKSGGGMSTDIVQNGKTPVITFDQKTHDFGDVVDGEIVGWTFDFTNTGNGDLLITDAHPSCSCTVPEWPKELIKPGEKGSIKVKFNAGRIGLNEKTISIEGNTNPKTTILKITANVKEAPKK